MTCHLIQTVGVLAIGVYASAMLTVVGALSAITLTSFGAIATPF